VRIFFLGEDLEEGVKKKMKKGEFFGVDLKN